MMITGYRYKLLNACPLNHQSLFLLFRCQLVTVPEQEVPCLFQILKLEIINKSTSRFPGVTSGCREQVNDVVNGLVSLVVGGFEFAVGPINRVRLSVEPAVG